MKVLIVGYYGFRNLGDEAILRVMLRELGRSLEQAEFVVTSGDPATTAMEHSVGAIHWRDIPAMVQAVADSDMVILGGGGLFHDIWGFPGETLLTRDHWGIPFFAGPAVLAAMFEKPLALYGVGVEGISDPTARRMTRAIFELSWTASVRDGISASFLREMGVSQERYTVTADPVWLLGSRQMKRRVAPQRGDGRDRPRRIGVALRNWDVGVEPEVWLDEVAAALEDFSHMAEATIVMVPFQALKEDVAYDDRTVAREIVQRFKDPGNVEVTSTPANGAAAIEIFRDCDLVLGMRYHSLLLAALAGVPVVGLAYAPKVLGLMGQLGVEEYCCSVIDVDRHELGATLRHAWQSREDVRIQLKDRTRSLKRKARGGLAAIKDLASGKIGSPSLTPEAKALLLESSTGAIVTAAKRTAEVLNLVSERQGLQRKQEELENELLKLRVRHEGLELERKELGQRLRDAETQREDLDRRLVELTVWHEVLKKERNGLVERLEGIQREQRDLIHRLEEVQEWHERLKRDHGEAVRRLEEALGERDGLAERLEQAEERHAQLKEAHENLYSGHQALEKAFHDLETVHREIVSSRLYSLLSIVWRIRGGARQEGKGSGGEKASNEQSSKEDDLKSWEAFAFERFRANLERAFGDVGSRSIRRNRIGRVSLVVLTGTAGDNLLVTLECLRELDWKHLEVLVSIPDGRQGLEQDVLRLARKSGVNITVTVAPGETLPELLWAAARRCSGEAVLWVCAGDQVHPAAVRRMAEMLEENERCDGICAAYASIANAADQEKEEHEENEPGSDLGEFNMRPIAVNPPWAVMVRRGVLDFVGPPGEFVGKMGLSDLLMRMNEMVNLGTMQEGPILFLSEGRSNQEDQTQTLQSMAVFDDFRRNLFQGKVLWKFRTRSGIDCDGPPLVEHLAALARERGDVVGMGEVERAPDAHPRLWLPSVIVQIEESSSDEGKGGAGFLVTEGISEEEDQDWDLGVVVHRGLCPRDGCPKGTWHLSTEQDVVRLIRFLAMIRHLRVFESHVVHENPARTDIDASVIVCTHRPIEPLESALASLARQDMDPSRFEVIIVNNNPQDDGLHERLREIEDRHFRRGSVMLRTVVCPVPGLSHARNAGIAAARGEVLLFLDDDAVAPRDWVSTALSLFESHRDFGVIGGFIRLVPPEPKPKVIHPGWERYWSQYLKGRESFFEVRDWWDYPWGASWCARRSVLLQIGGFRVGYGRTKGDFAGGEEVVAASLASRLGWKIGVAPELEVEHHVIRERFTWRHVKKTLLAGTMGNYRMQRDLYIPMDDISWTVHCLFSLSFDRTVGANTALARLRHWSYRKRAWARLLRVQLQDRRQRERPPRYGTSC